MCSLGVAGWGGEASPPSGCPMGTVHTGNIQDLEADGDAVENLVSVDARPRWDVQDFPT